MWRYSGKSRIIIEFFATAILAIIMHIFVNEVLVEAPHLSQRMDNFLAIEKKYQSIANTSSVEYQRAEAYYRNYYGWM